MAAVAGAAGSAGITAAGNAEAAETTATLIASIHEQGQAARINAKAEGAKALATVHD